MQIIWPNDLKAANHIHKVSTFFWKVMILQCFIGHLVIRSNNLHNLETSWTADVGVT